MLIDVICAIASTWLLIASIAVEPERSICPQGWWLAEGVRSDGRFVCYPQPPAIWVHGPRGGWTDVSKQPPGFLMGRVYCRLPRPVTVDGVTINCEEATMRLPGKDRRGDAKPK